MALTPMLARLSLADGNEDEDKHAGPSCSLATLPEDVILRIISLSGSACNQMRAAFSLGGTCRRLRAVLHDCYLPSLPALSQDALEALALSDPNRATAALHAALLRATAVRRLVLSGYSPQVFTPPCFDALALAAAPTLTAVNLAHSFLSDACVRPLLTRCTSLATVSLCYCANITGAAFGADLAAPLTHLDLSYMSALEPGALRRLSGMSTIRVLKLAGLSVVNSTGLGVIGNGRIRRGLEEVDLKYCTVGDEAILEFAHNCPALRKLTLAKHHDNLWETGQYTAAAIHELRESFPHIKVVIENV